MGVTGCLWGAGPAGEVADPWPSSARSAVGVPACPDPPGPYDGNAGRAARSATGNPEPAILIGITRGAPMRQALLAVLAMGLVLGMGCRSQDIAAAPEARPASRTFDPQLERYGLRGPAGPVYHKGDLLLRRHLVAYPHNVELLGSVEMQRLSAGPWLELAGEHSHANQVTPVDPF